MDNTTSYWQELYSKSQELALPQQACTELVLNHDLGLPAEVQTCNADWQPSPAKGVKRLLLERMGGEKATRATSIVSYAPGSYFEPHAHPKGEEFLVLSGTFSDEYGDYPAGTYVRNPPGTRHKPYSKDGCMIFVKLQQFRMTDNERVVIKLNEKRPDEAKLHYNLKTLFKDYERVEIVNVKENCTLPEAWMTLGAEILILAGSISDGNQVFTTGSWLRLPVNTPAKLTALKNATFYLKFGHLGDEL
ncbi:cupin domain-containing protein [Thalassomonas viridans]|uniref:Cupin domain-containing protein n=1 Tax=Thalassomonas viridans TaxID=137584 RepID=A0AAF0CDJ2_9GAMM|nr:cupin domain-containing protein [Thalassomonas viridans]WDE08866.1 cupin domain-containing protein [Thalassomonas viridans]